jgi:hypothetical protein
MILEKPLYHQAFRRDEDVVEEHRAPTHRLGADVVEMRPGDPLLVEIDKEGADPMGAILDPASTREDDGGIALIGKAHRRLFAVQTVAISGLLGTQDEIGRIGAPARLGQTKPDDGVAARYPRQPFPCDDGRGVLGDHAAHQRSQQLNVTRIEIAIGDLLDNDAGGGAALAEAAIFFRQIDADQAEAAHFLQHRAVDAILPGSLLIVGS